MDFASVGIARALRPIRLALCITCERRWALATAGRRCRSRHPDDSERGAIATLLGATEDGDREIPGDKDDIDNFELRTARTRQARPVSGAWNLAGGTGDCYHGAGDRHGGTGSTVQH